MDAGPRLGLGLAALGRPGYLTLGHGADLARTGREVDAMRAHAAALLSLAEQLGLRYVDAARSYGRAEEFLADWLRNGSTAAGGWTVASKWGYRYTAGWRVDADVHEVKDHSLAHLDAQYVETRALLGDALNIYQVHSATLESGVLDDRAVLDRLAELRDTGLVIGLTTSGPEQARTVRRALEVSVDGAPVFGAVQSTWNLLEPSVAPALVEARSAGWLVVVKEAVANGRLATASPAPGALVAEATRLDTTCDAVALAAALAQPWSSVVLSGAATEEQLRSNVGAVRLDVDLDRLTALAEPAPAYWQTRANLPWT
jgi:aryl-alcohol dehydrogenase-like predicted oxidoreductase